MKNKKGQVWVETVLYTLIGLGLIALVLAFVSPRITQEKERILVEQTIQSLNVIDDKINTVLEKGEGNRRIVEFGISKGELYFNSTDDKIVFVFRELKKPYTEPGVEIEFGRVKIFSIEGKKTSQVYLTLDYGNSANLTFAGKDEDRKFDPAAKPYEFSIENLGRNNSLFEVVDIGLVA